MTRPPARGSRKGSVASRLRSQIEAAEADGGTREEMLLKLTHSDASHLKRDSELAVTDISFSAGVMRFLGVRVEEGGVAESVLERG